MELLAQGVVGGAVEPRPNLKTLLPFRIPEDCAVLPLGCQTFQITTGNIASNLPKHFHSEDSIEAS